MAINVESQVRTLALKFYIEQLMPAQERQKYTQLLAIRDDKNANVYQQQNAMMTAKEIERIYYKKFFDLIENFKYKDYKIVAIYHDKDYTETKGSPFVPSIKKGHWHVVIWRDNFKVQKKRFRIKTIIKMLGLCYAPQLDTELWKKKGAEVVKSSISNYVTYFLHETQDAIDAGKHQYNKEEIAKNFSNEELEEIFKYYEKTRKKSSIDWDELDREAVSRGHNILDFDNWIKTKLSVVQRASSTFKVVRKDYEEALNEGITRKGDVLRCSILIYGRGNLGKTYNTLKAFKALGLRYYDAGTGSGKFDNLTALHQAMTFNDVGVKNAKNVFDNRAVLLHRRFSGDRPWLGKYAVLTCNDDPFEEICAMAGITIGGRDYDSFTKSEKDNYDAISQRLYICRINPMTKELVCEKKQERGGDSDKYAHNKLFDTFKTMFEMSLANYDYTPDALDYKNESDAQKKDKENKEKALKRKQKFDNVVQLNQEKQQVSSGSINPF